MPIEPGTLIAERYRVEAVLGEGGMGKVLRGYDPRLERPVAIKVVRPDRLLDAAPYRERFLREARVLAKVTHPNVVTVHDLGEQDGDLYLVMELLDGATLRQRLAGSAGVGERLAWLRDAARALAAAHDVSLVHRDIKPENLFVTTAGVLKVIDFGLARTVGPGVLGGTVTQTGQVLGTPDYMSPEQLIGGEVDGRADQYAWALVAHEVLTGALPARGQAVDLTRDPRLSPMLAECIHRALARTPEDRYPTMLDVAAVVERAIEGGGEALPPTRPSAEIPRRDVPSALDSGRAGPSTAAPLPAANERPPETARLPGAPSPGGETRLSPGARAAPPREAAAAAKVATASDPNGMGGLAHRIAHVAPLRAPSAPRVPDPSVESSPVHRNPAQGRKRASTFEDTGLGLIATAAAPVTITLGALALFIILFFIIYFSNSCGR